MPDPRYKPHKAMSLRFKPSIAQMLEETANRMGISQTAVIMIAVRELALKHGVTEPSDSNEEEEVAA